jgi:2-polyprenyl-3-methyl-5-hydroxy-6-metoxy-1,4-benzoquinol methylase
VHVHDISGVEVVAGAERIDRDRIPERDFDLVVCSQVLEHVPSPAELMREIASVLSPHTLLYVEVPHEPLIRDHPGDLNLGALKRHWHEHVNFYTEPSLRRLLDQAGLQVLASHFLPYDNGSRKGEVMGVIASVSPTLAGN